VPYEGTYTEIFNSDSKFYDGSNVGNGAVVTESVAWMNQPYSININVPPLGALILKILKLYSVTFYQIFINRTLD